MDTLKRIFINGGVTTPNKLKEIIQLAKALNLNSLSFGSRQDILLPVKENQEHLLKTYFPEFKQDVEDNYKFQNIVSSYVCADIFPQTSWLSATTYLYLHEEFKSNPTLKINLVDPQQNLIPIFNGQLNFIASKDSDFWYLNLNLPGWDENLYYPVLVYTWNIAAVAKAIEEEYKNFDNVNDLFNRVNELVDTNNKVITEPLTIPYQPFPYYEGMNKMGISEYWLGLYWRNNKYDIEFLDQFCDFCMDYKISRICITPWKSFIIKGLDREYKFMLEKFLGQRGINIRHSSLELNWHLPVDNKEATQLKRFIVKSFDQNDISTYGLTIGYHERDRENSQYFTSMIIEKNPSPKLVNGFENFSTYNVLYAKKFDPNSREYISYAQNVEQLELPGLLMQLSQLYFTELDNSTENVVKPKNKNNLSNTKNVHQCKHCMTIYDEEFGDELANISAGTSFSDLPDSYTCHLCDAPKSAYTEVEL